MNIKEIKELVDLVARRGIASLEIESEGFRVKIEGSHPPMTSSMTHVIDHGPSIRMPESATGSMEQRTGSAGFLREETPERPQLFAPSEDPSLHVIKSPIVGTFYGAPNPEAEPFVKVGDSVEKGQTLCIVEAMKLMNEIESDASGTVAGIFPQNGQPVEYGEKLFAIKVR